MKSLRDIMTTIDWMNFRGTFPQGKVYSSKKVIREEEERLRLRKEKKLEQEKRVKLRIKESKKKTEEEKKATKIEDFEKLKKDILAQSRREPIRNCTAFNFVEPAPGCHYDIGNSFGYVLIPIPKSREGYELDQEEMLEFVHECTFYITEQVFDNFGGRVDVQE